MTSRRHLLGSGLASLAVLGTAVAPGIAAGPEFDVSRYRPALLRDLLRTYPSQPGVTLSPDLPVRSRVVYSGRFRHLPSDSHRLIDAWGEAMRMSGMPEIFRQETKVSQGGVDYWMPIQESLVPLMQAELRPGEEIDLFIIYVGQTEGRHVMLINAFRHDDPHEPRR